MEPSQSHGEPNNMRGSSGAACDSDAERIDRRLRGSSRHCCFGVGANEVGASVCILDRIARSGGLGTSGGGIRHRRNALARRDICRGSEFCNSGDHRRGIESRLGKAGYEPKEDWLMPRLMRLRMLVSAFGPHNIRASGAAIHSTFSESDLRRCETHGIIMHAYGCLVCNRSGPS